VSIPLFGMELILIICSSSLFVVRMNFRKLGIKNFWKLIIPLIRKFRKQYFSLIQIFEIQLIPLIRNGFDLIVFS